MADMQQLERAFLNAHKAGDTKAAGVLAAEIKRQRAAASSEAPVSGLMDQFWAGVDSNTELPGQTLEALGKTADSQGLQDAGKKLRGITSVPDNFVSATDRFVNPKQGDSYVDPVLGFGWGNLPGAAAQVGGQMAGDIAARTGIGLAGAGVGSVIPGVGSAAGGVAGALAGPAALEFMRVAGPVAMDRARNNGREVPTWEDWQAAAAAAGLSGALNAIGIKGIGALNDGVREIGKKTIGQTVKEVAKETGKKSIKEGLTETGQSLIEQTGSTLGTDSGLKIDLKQAVGEGILGAGAGGVIDAGRNIRPTISAVNDIRSVNADMRNNPDAQAQAEITLKVNEIADRMKGSGKAPVSKEINESVKHLKDQIGEALKNQNLSPEDKTAIKNALNTANGMDAADIDAIAGRSETPSEIKALLRKIQVVREMTVQKQTAKGMRGWAAAAARYGGGIVGGALGAQLGGYQGAGAGAAIGQSMGIGIARRLSGNQTQGNNIDKLVGKTQARRAAMLLDRFGPSEATTALNTLTERAAANKAQAEADAQAKKDVEETMSRIRFRNKMRADSQRAEEQAKSKAEKDKIRAERAQKDLIYRDARLKGAVYKAEQAKTLSQMLANKLEAEKSLNALRVEMEQAKRDLQQHTIEQKAADAKFKADSRSLDLEGKIAKLSHDIQMRESARRRSDALAKRAEKMAARVPEAVTAAQAVARQTARRYAQMSSDQIAAVKTDQYGNPIKDSAQYAQQAERIKQIEADGLNAAASLPDKELGNIFIRAIRDFQTYRGRKNQDKRMAIYETVMAEVSPSDLDAQRFVMMYIRPLAFAFDAESSMSGSGTEDFGTNNGPGEDPPF